MWQKLPEPQPFQRSTDDSTILEPGMSFTRTEDGFTEYLHLVRPEGHSGLIAYRSNRRDMSCHAPFVRYEASAYWPAEVIMAAKEVAWRGVIDKVMEERMTTGSAEKPPVIKVVKKPEVKTAIDPLQTSSAAPGVLIHDNVKTKSHKKQTKKPESVKVSTLAASSTAAKKPSGTAKKK